MGTQLWGNVDWEEMVCDHERKLTGEKLKYKVKFTRNKEQMWIMWYCDRRKERQESIYYNWIYIMCIKAIISQTKSLIQPFKTFSSKGKKLVFLWHGHKLLWAVDNSKVGSPKLLGKEEVACKVSFFCTLETSNSRIVEGNAQ